MIALTKHAWLRMQERAIDSKEIEEVLQNTYLAYEAKGYTIIGKTKKGRHITLIINKEKQTLITAWPSKRKERKLYEEKITKI